MFFLWALLALFYIKSAKKSSEIPGTSFTNPLLFWHLRNQRSQSLKIINKGLSTKNAVCFYPNVLFSVFFVGVSPVVRSTKSN